MRLRLSVDVVIEENGDIGSYKSMEVEDLTEEGAAVLPDLNLLQNAFRSGIVSVLTEEPVFASDPDGSDDDDLDTDDDDLDVDIDLDEIDPA